MTSFGWIQIIVFALIILVLVKPLGTFIADVMQEEDTFLDSIMRPAENFIYKLYGVNVNEAMPWRQYAFAMLCFSMVSMIFSYVVLAFQGSTPLNPMGFSTLHSPEFATKLTPDLIFNTAASFTSNTNWQSYSGEMTMSYLSQMLGLAFHNWVSAAVGIAVSVALARGFLYRGEIGIGNFWKDLTRITLYILLPLCSIYAIFLIGQGVVQNFSPYTTVTTLEKCKQLIAQGPVSSQEAIKMLGTNGGGFFNANSAHPYENPTPLTNLIEMISIFLIPGALTYTFGYMVKDVRQGWALLITMFILFFAGILICYHFEAMGNPNVANQGVETSARVLGDLGGNMEGKEVRFGLANSALFATVTTDASCGAVNSMHDSFTPLGGLIPLLNMQLGEIVFGGVGAGLYGIVVFAILTVFIAGLMVGRTPEYIGKKIEKKEVKMAMLFTLTAAACILLFSGIASVLELPEKGCLNPPGATYSNVGNAGVHGLSEIIYAYSSGTANNGSAFAGLNANTPFWNTTLGLAMLLGRFGMMVPVLAIAGTLASKKYVPPTSGTFPTHSGTFIVLLLCIILIVGALTYFPVLTLGPIAEHFLMQNGRLF